MKKRLKYFVTKHAINIMDYFPNNKKEKFVNFTLEGMGDDSSATISLANKKE